MGLETGDFISELNASNPIGASDPKSQGDDHIRLIKKAVLGSFPNFVGTTGTPKSVTLTEDQINAALQATATATISALWNYTTVPTINSELAGTLTIVQNIQNAS